MIPKYIIILNSGLLAKIFHCIQNLLFFLRLWVYEESVVEFEYCMLENDLKLTLYLFFIYYLYETDKTHFLPETLAL